MYKSAADIDSMKPKELEIRQTQFESKPRNGEETRREDRFLYQTELEKKSEQKRRNHYRKNPQTVNTQGRELVNDKDRGEEGCVITGNLSNPGTPPSGDNCKARVARNVNGFVSRQRDKTGRRKLILEPDTAGSVHRFRKCLSLISPSKIILRNSRKKRTRVSKHDVVVARNCVLSPTMNHSPSATTNHTTSATMNRVSSAVTKNTQFATTNHAPPVSSKRRFCILNRSDKNSLRAQISIWFPCLCHKPTLKALQDAFIRMKCSLFQELRKLEIIDFNKHLTESKDQRYLFRKEHLHERSSMCRPISFISNVVPECQKRICSLNFDGKDSPLASLKNIRANCDKEQKPINSETNPRKNPERCPFTGNEWRRRHSLMYLDCEKLQMAAPRGISTTAYNHENVKQFAENETKQFYIPAWFQTMLRKEVIINIHPMRQSELTESSSEIKQLTSCQRRIQLGHLFPNSDFSAGDGRLLISVREQEIKPQSGICELLPMNVPTTSSRSHSSKSRQKEDLFDRDTREVGRGLGVSVPVKYGDLNDFRWSKGNCSRGSHRHFAKSTPLNCGQNYKGYIYKNVPVNTEDKQDFMSQEDSELSSAEYTPPELGNRAFLERSGDKMRHWKDVYLNQPPLFNADAGTACLSISDSISSQTYQEIKGKPFGTRASNVLSETKLAAINTFKQLQDRRHMGFKKAIPEINNAVRKKSEIAFKERLLNYMNTEPSENNQKECLWWPHNQYISVYRPRSKSCGNKKCCQLRNTRKRRTWIREFRSVPTPNATDEELKTIAFQTDTASKQLVANDRLDKGILYPVKDTNLRANTCPKKNKTRSCNLVRRERERTEERVNKSNSSVHGINAESSQAIVVDDLMDSQELCTPSNGESNLNHAILSRMGPNTEASTGIGSPLADNTTEPQALCVVIDEPTTLCMAINEPQILFIPIDERQTLCTVTDAESKLNPLIMVQSDKDIHSLVVTETSVVENGVDSQARNMQWETEPNWDQTLGINLDKDMQSKVVQEICLMDGVVQSCELSMGITTQSKLEQPLLMELCENVQTNTMSELNETKYLDYKHDNFKLVKELNARHLQVEKDACITWLSSCNKHFSAKSRSAVDRKTKGAYLNNSAKISESESPPSLAQDVNCFGTRSLENESTSLILNYIGRELRDKQSTSGHGKTTLSNENKEFTYSTSSNAVRMTSRESLIDFIKEQWRSCQSSVTDQVINEKQANLLQDSRFSSRDISQRSSPTLCQEMNQIFYRDDETEGQKRLQSEYKDKSYETMCSERRENYLKICRTLENYYKSSSNDDCNSISSISASDPQKRQHDSVNSHTVNISKTLANGLLRGDKIDETPNRSEIAITKNAPVTFNYEKYFQPGYQTLNSFIESTRKFLSTDAKPVTYTQTCNVKGNKLSEIEIVPEVISGLRDYGIITLPQKQINRPPSSPCAEGTNQNMMSNTTDLVSSKLVIPNDETEWITNTVKSPQTIQTKKPREVFTILTALDKLLERYFHSIEELQRRLENCYIRALKCNKRKKVTQKRDNRLQNVKIKRQKKKMSSESACNVYQSFSYERLNSLVTAEGALLERLKRCQFMKSLAWDCSVNNKEDSPPDSVPSDVDLIDARPKKSKKENQRDGTEAISGKESQLDNALNQGNDAPINADPKLLNEGSLGFPDDKFEESPIADAMAISAEKILTSRKSSINTSIQQTPQLKPPRMQESESKRASVDTGALTRFSSRLSTTPEYPGLPQADSSFPRYRKQNPGSDRASADYLTRDVGTITRQNQLTDTHRQVYSSIYDTDSNIRPPFSHDESPFRRMRTSEKQESYNLTTREHEYDTQPINSYRHTSPEYVGSEWTPGSTTIPELRSNGKSEVSTEPSRKYFFPATESRDYFNGGMTPRELPERREFAGQAKFTPTFKSQPRVRLPDYCMGFSRTTDRPTTPARREKMRNIGLENEKKSKKLGSDSRELSEAQVWFRDLCERVNTNSRINGEVSQPPRRKHEDSACENLRIDARICATPTISYTVDGIQRNTGTLAVRDFRGTPFKERGTSYRTPEMDKRLLNPCKNYNDIALLENTPNQDLNIRRRPQGFSDYLYSQLNQTEVPTEDHNTPFSHAVVENLSLARQTEQLPKTKMDTPFELNYPTERNLETPRQIIPQANVDNIKECASVCTQTCACISKPNGTCLCGCISMNETLWPNTTNEILAPVSVRNSEHNLNFKSVCIQTCDNTPDDVRMDRNDFQKGKNIVAQMRSRQCSPIQLKCRNKKCQVGRSVQCKNEYTGIGASLSNGLTCKTVPTPGQRYDRKPEQNVSTVTKCVQTCSFSKIRNNKRPSGENKIICCKCKQRLDGVMVRQFETPDLSTEMATYSFENDNDKECQCDTFQEGFLPGLDPVTRNENVYPYAKYQTKPPYMQSCAFKNGLESNALSCMVSEDPSDEEWDQGNEKQPTPRFRPIQAERVPHLSVERENACVISHELTEQISGIIRNSRLLQQQAVLLRNKCKYLEGQGWTSINQNRHEALNACRSPKCCNMLRCHSFRKKTDNILDKNNNASMQFEPELNWKQRFKYCNIPDCYACSTGSQLALFTNDNVPRMSRPYYRNFIRKYLGHKAKLEPRVYFLRKRENKNCNWNAKPRKSPADLVCERSSQVCVYKHPQNERYFINEPSQEAYQYLREHFPDIYRSAASHNHRRDDADDLLFQGQHCRGGAKKEEYIKQKLGGKYSATLRISDGASGNIVCLKEQNVHGVKQNTDWNVSVQLSEHNGNRTKSQNDAKSGEETSEALHNGEAVYTMDEAAYLHQRMYSAYNDVGITCHNEFGLSFSQDNNSVHLTPENMSCKGNNWQLAGTIGSLSGTRQPKSHSRSHYDNQLNKQRQKKAPGENGGRLGSAGATNDLTRALYVPGVHKETHSVGTMVSFSHLHEPSQQCKDKKVASYFPVADPAYNTCLDSPQTCSPDTSVLYSCDSSTCLNIIDSPAVSFQATEKPHNLYQSPTDIHGVSDFSKQKSTLTLLGRDELGSDASSSNTSLISIKIVPIEVRGVRVLKEMFLDTLSANIPDIDKNKSLSEVEHQLFRDDKSQMLLQSDTFQQQGCDQMQLWEKHAQSVSLRETSLKHKTSPVAHYVPLQKVQYKPKSEVKCPSNQTHNVNVLDSQDSNIGIEDIPLDSTVSECKTTGRNPMKLKDRSRSKAIFHASLENERKVGVINNRPLPLRKQIKMHSDVKNSQIKLTGSKWDDPMPSKWENVVCIQNAVLLKDTTGEPKALTSFQRQQARVGESSQQNQFEVSMPSSEDTDKRRDAQEESGNNDVVSWWNSPEFFKEMRIRKDKIKYTTVASRSCLRKFSDTLDLSASSKKFRCIPNKSNTAIRRHVDLHGRNSATTAVRLEYSRNNMVSPEMASKVTATLRNSTAQPEMSSTGTASPRNFPICQRSPTYKTNNHLICDKWRTSFLGCAEIIDANDHVVFLEGTYTRRLSSVQNGDESKINAKEVDGEGSKCARAGLKVVQFRLAVSRDEGSDDAVDLQGIYSRQLPASGDWFNWKLIF